MSAEPCAKCGRMIYGAEPQVKCLGKTWHKGCFKCTTCSMTLNLKNWKGFEKNPYCEAHTPKPQPSSDINTPEWIRWQENSKIQSDAAYQAEFKKEKYTGYPKMEQEPQPVYPTQNYDSYEEEEEVNVRSNSGPPVVPIEPYVPQQSRTSTGSGILKNTATQQQQEQPAKKYPAMGVMPQLPPSNYNPVQQQQPMAAPSIQSGLCYRALFDYDAMDYDEVDFLDGDLIVDCTPVDQGWLTGTVHRTGRRGMLPANYVIYTHTIN